MAVSSSDFIQAVRGPLMLITLGVLIAVHQFGMLSFSTSWPVLVIVFGVLKLLERTTRQPAPAPAAAGPYTPPSYPPYSPTPGTPGYNIPPSPPPPPGGTRV
ncbi:MAG TPA: DUF5668 domain-containing protein [Bryobacteraceae bacterium]|jgi:hypothetical protein|nr:DUF5668 domain-containing protein [Bryobacteraceae bacterium]